MAKASFLEEVEARKGSALDSLEPFEAGNTGILENGHF